MGRCLGHWRLRVLALMLCVAASCTTYGHYLVAPADVERVAALSPAARERESVPARREKGGAEVLLRASDLHLSSATPLGPSAGTLRLRASAYSPVVTAGAALTSIGSVISVLGTVLFFTYGGFSGPSGDRGLWIGSGVLALGAEPLMITGTVLWIRGLMRPAHERRR